MAIHHPKSLKESIIKKVLTPGGLTFSEAAEKYGVHEGSIRRWVRTYAKTPSMKNSQEWTPEAKLKAIAETLSMTENQLGEYLRANGLHSSELEQWKQEFYSSQKPPGRPKTDPEVVELRNKEKELSKDLRRKDRALAEMSARIVLLKKSRMIWGDSEDED